MLAARSCCQRCVAAVSAAVTWAVTSVCTSVLSPPMGLPAFSSLSSSVACGEGLGTRHTGKCDALRPYRCHEGLRSCNVRLHKCLFTADGIACVFFSICHCGLREGLETRHTGRCDARRPYRCREGTRDLPENGLHRDDGFA
jgi:hypothetical protein